VQFVTDTQNLARLAPVVHLSLSATNTTRNSVHKYFNYI